MIKETGTITNKNYEIDAYIEQQEMLRKKGYMK